MQRLVEPGLKPLSDEEENDLTGRVLIKINRLNKEMNELCTDESDIGQYNEKAFRFFSDEILF
jgi:hypothetical protein